MGADWDEAESEDDGMEGLVERGGMGGGGPRGVAMTFFCMVFVEAKGRMRLR